LAQQVWRVIQAMAGHEKMGRVPYVMQIERQLVVEPVRDGPIRILPDSFTAFLARWSPADFRVIGSAAVQYAGNSLPRSG
jgi:hypothetical protein